jgi:hypothetical protein
MYQVNYSYRSVFDRLAMSRNSYNPWFYDTFQKWGTTRLNMGLTFLADRDKATLSVSHRSKALFLPF